MLSFRAQGMSQKSLTKPFHTFGVSGALFQFFIELKAGQKINHLHKRNGTQQQYKKHELRADGSITLRRYDEQRIAIYYLI